MVWQARVWHGELPACDFDPGIICKRTFTASLPILKKQVGALEIYVPLGPRFMYGLIGGDLQPASNNELKVGILTSNGQGELFRNPLCESLDEARIGLPDEYARAVSLESNLQRSKVTTLQVNYRLLMLHSVKLDHVESSLGTCQQA